MEKKKKKEDKLSKARPMNKFGGSVNKRKP